MTKIINLFSKEPDRNLYEKEIAAKEQERKENLCSHNNGLEWNNIDKIVGCTTCGKRYHPIEFLNYHAEKGSIQQINSMYNIRNNIHFLTEKKEGIESDIEFLRKEKRKLNAEIKKLKGEIPT